MAPKNVWQSVGFKISLIIWAIMFAVILSLLAINFWQDTLPVLGGPGHRVGAFSFINQDGDTITEKTVGGKIRVVGYFFSTCKGICPIMNHHLQVVQAAFSGRNDVIILSHTVDPDNDSVPVLKKYATAMHTPPHSWMFLTGSKYALYTMAAREYLLSPDTVTEANIPNAFIHTQYVALVDKNNCIRGFYDATNKTMIAQLIKDIKRL